MSEDDVDDDSIDRHTPRWISIVSYAWDVGTVVGFLLLVIFLANQSIYFPFIEWLLEWVK